MFDTVMRKKAYFMFMLSKQTWQKLHKLYGHASDSKCCFLSFSCFVADGKLSAFTSFHLVWNRPSITVESNNKV